MSMYISYSQYIGCNNLVSLMKPRTAYIEVATQLFPYLHTTISPPG